MVYSSNLTKRQDVQALIQRAEDEHPDQEIAGLLHIGGGLSWWGVGPIFWGDCRTSIYPESSGFVGKYPKFDDWYIHIATWTR